jgi:hypothetical protein
MKKREWLWILFLLALGLIFWRPLLQPGMAPFLRDLSSEIIPKRGFWAASGGFALWDRLSYLGMPFAANPQSEAFYPANIIFLLLRPERAAVFYIVIHHLFFLATLYPALRRLGFSSGASLVATMGFGFGGYLISLTLLVVLLSTFVWFPLVLILLTSAMEKRWLRASLWLGLVVAVQILAGEVEIAGQSWMLALCAAAFSPNARNWRKDLPRLLGAMLIGLAIGLVLTLPQTLLSFEMIPLSNRAHGESVADALIWSLKPYALKSFLVPNYLLPLYPNRTVVHWGLGFFSGYGYLLSFYLGCALLGLSLFAFARPQKRQLWVWLAIAAFGVLLAMGEDIPVYKFFHQHLPGFKLFRIPQKFILFTAFSVSMLAGLGFEELRRLKLSRPKLSALLLLCGAVAILMLIAYPLKLSELGNQYEQVEHYLLLRSIFRVCGLFLVMLGLMFLLGNRSQGLEAALLSLAIFSDLYLAHHRLNERVALDFFKPNPYIRGLEVSEKDRVVPVRILSVIPDVHEMILQRVMDPIAFYTGIRNIMEPFWAMYYGFNDVRAVASFYLSDFMPFSSMIFRGGVNWERMALARASVEYFYKRDAGFEKIYGVFPRAAVFYQVRSVSGLEEMELLWSDPNFPASIVLAVEGQSGMARSGSGLLRSDPARIEEYANQKVVIAAEAKQDGWLLLLDSYYPGWTATVDGKPAPIYRADGFFRAVPVPAGRHLVTFRYFPGFFWKSAIFSGFCLLLLAAFLIIPGRKLPR